MNVIGDNEIPIGLGMALAQNTNALNYFASLDKDKQEQIINHTHEITSKKEMQHFVNELGNNKFF